MSREIITCTCGCGRTGPIGHKTNRWIAACTRRWRNAGRPADGPPPPRPLSRADLAAAAAHASRARARERASRALALADTGLTAPQIADLMGLHPKTVEKYLRLARPKNRDRDAGAVMQAWQRWTERVADRIATGHQVSLDWIWQDKAACRGQPVDRWVPEYVVLPEPVEECIRCPVREECLTHALTKPEGWGIWASTTPEDRRRLRRKITDLRIQT